MGSPGTDSKGLILLPIRLPDQESPEPRLMKPKIDYVGGGGVGVGLPAAPRSMSWEQAVEYMGQMGGRIPVQQKLHVLPNMKGLFLLNIPSSMSGFLNLPDNHFVFSPLFFSWWFYVIFKPIP